MPDILTTNYDLVKPENGASADDWGIKWNENADKIDDALADIQTDATAAQSSANLRLLTANKLSEFDDSTKKSDARSNIGAQTVHAILTSLSASGGTANTVPYFSSSNVVSLTNVSALARTLLNESGSVGMQAQLGLRINGQAIWVQSGTPGSPADGDIWVW